jgi:transposase-like protein
MARGLPLPAMRVCRRVDCRRWALQVRELRRPDIGNGGNSVRSPANASDGVVRGVLDVRCGQGRHIGAELAAGAGDRLLPDGVGADASATSLHAFVTDHVEPGATVITDAWQGYRGLDKLGYVHHRRSQRAARARGEDRGDLLPAVHRVASLIKRWLLGTHQGSVEVAHLPSYMNEFVFRFNRRHSRSRGLIFYRVLQLAIAHDPVRYRDLVANPQPKTTPPTPPGKRGSPPSIDRPRAARPWRTTDQG